jgi:hypothetical protein
MALINEYMLSETAKKEVNGAQVIAISGNFETTAADDAGSKYRICKVGADWVPLQIQINNDAIAGADDVDLGLYETLENGGAVKDADCFIDGDDIHAGAALGSEIDGLQSLDIDEIGDQMYEHAGDDDASAQMYDLVLTSNNAITGAGTIAIRALFLKAA